MCCHVFLLNILIIFEHLGVNYIILVEGEIIRSPSQGIMNLIQEVVETFCFGSQMENGSSGADSQNMRSECFILLTADEQTTLSPPNCDEMM